MSEESRILGGRYQLGEVIGRGGMAEVHRGTDLRLGREVAVKVLRQDLARDPAFIARFQREAHSAAALNHPNIVSVYDTGEDEVNAGLNSVTVPWIVMEYVDGITLRQILNSGHKIEPARALDITVGILAALDYSHRHGIIHRDIKPGNVMLTKQGAIKVMDFGIARAVADSSATMTHTNTVMGTAQYLSPEQARGESVDARSDLYSTGCVLFELLTGRPPFVGDSPMAIAYQHVAQALTSPSEINPEVPQSFDAVLHKAMAKHPRDRYQTAADMRADVNRLLHGELPEAEFSDIERTAKITPVSRGVEVSNRNSKAVGLLVAGAGVLALVIGALVLASKLITPSPIAQVTVPNLEGKTIAEATTLLNDAQLAIGQTSYQIDETHPAGTVISQNPGANATVDKGSSVDIVVSKTKDQVAVPTLVNFVSVDDARAALTAVGLTLGAVKFEDSDLPANMVLRSDPEAGTFVDTGSAVAIWVSSGKVPVPNVINKTQDEATTILYNLQFLVDVVLAEDDTVAPGTVIGQTPAEGTSLAPGQTVTITVSVLPGDPTTPPVP